MLLRTIVSRLAFAPLILVALVTLSFLLTRLAPGSPFNSERAASTEVVQALNAKHGLDQPLVVQFSTYVGKLAQGDLGVSYKQAGRTVNEILAERLLPSLELGALALLVAVGVGVGVGVFAALRHNRLADHTAMAGALLCTSLPTFVIGPLLILAARQVGWENSGVGQAHASFAWMLLAGIALGLPFAARIARLARSGMLEVLHQDYIRAARARGLPEWRVIVLHALGPGLMPVLGYLGPAVATILTGSLVVEKIFGLPGLGREFVDSALNRDYPLVMGTVLLFGAFIVVCNVLADITLIALDPRLRKPA